MKYRTFLWRNKKYRMFLWRNKKYRTFCGGIKEYGERKSTNIIKYIFVD